MGSAQSGRRGGGSTAGDGKDGKGLLLERKCGKIYILKRSSNISIPRGERKDADRRRSEMGPKTSFEFTLRRQQRKCFGCRCPRYCRRALGLAIEMRFLSACAALQALWRIRKVSELLTLVFRSRRSSPSPSTVSPEAASVLLESIIKGKERGIKFKHDPERHTL